MKSTQGSYEEYDYSCGKYDDYDDFDMTHCTKLNASSCKKTSKNGNNVYSQKHVRNLTKRYNK